MSIFDLIKEKQEKNKNLKKEDLPNIPDEDLREVVMDWMFGKFNQNWSNEFEVVASLPKPCRDIYSCCTVTDEIYNGGINQLFFNSSSQFIDMALEGFTSIGNEKLTSILMNSIKIYNENSEILNQYMDGSLESFSESYKENLFDALDDEFYEETANFEELIVKYIRINSSYFGN